MNRFSKGLSAAIISGAVLLCSCSTNLGPETLPSTTPATEPEETTVETTELITPEMTDPSSVAVVTERIVDKYGELKIDGAKILNSEDEPVILKGMSSYGIEKCEGFFTPEIVKTLAEDWGCDILRISLTGYKESDGYLKAPEKYFDMVCEICNMCIDQGIYVLVDWNVAYTEDSDENEEVAVDFFSRLSAIYSDSPNVLYEVNNNAFMLDEDESASAEWSDDIKPFAKAVVGAIRENDPDTIIIVGTPKQCTCVDTAADSELDYDNIAYACRFFAGTHGEEYRETIESVIEDDVCVFINEWAMCTDTFTGGILYVESQEWMEFLSENQISWCNYAIGNDTYDDANALMFSSENYTFEQKYSGHWPNGLISGSGLFVREQLLLVETDDSADETESTDEQE